MGQMWRKLCSLWQCSSLGETFFASKVAFLVRRGWHGCLQTYVQEAHGSQEKLEQLRAWRSGDTALTLLSLAVACDNLVAVESFLSLGLQDETPTLDEPSSSLLLNHPLHLALWLDRPRLIPAIVEYTPVMPRGVVTVINHPCISLAWDPVVAMAHNKGILGSPQSLAIGEENYDSLKVYMEKLVSLLMEGRMSLVTVVQIAWESVKSAVPRAEAQEILWKVFARVDRLPHMSFNEIIMLCQLFYASNWCLLEQPCGCFPLSSLMLYTADVYKENVPVIADYCSEEHLYQLFRDAFKSFGNRGLDDLNGLSFLCSRECRFHRIRPKQYLVHNVQTVMVSLLVRFLNRSPAQKTILQSLREVGSKLVFADNQNVAHSLRCMFPVLSIERQATTSSSIVHRDNHDGSGTVHADINNNTIFLRDSDDGSIEDRDNDDNSIFHRDGDDSDIDHRDSDDDNIVHRDSDDSGTVHRDSDDDNIVHRDSDDNRAHRNSDNIVHRDGDEGDIVHSDSDDGDIVHRDSDEGDIVHRDSDDGNIVHRDSDEGNIVHRDGDKGTIVHRDSDEGNIVHRDSDEGDIVHRDSDDGDIVHKDDDSSYGDNTNDDEAEGDDESVHLELVPDENDDGREERGNDDTLIKGRS